MKIFEALILLAAGVLFAWWQLRDVRIAQESTKKQRERERAQALERNAADANAGKAGESQ